MSTQLLNEALEQLASSALPQSELVDLKIYPEGYEEGNDCLLYLETTKSQ